MTVSSAVSSVNYLGNGATTVFPFTFYVSSQSYLVVQIVDNSVTPATTTTLSVGQYSVTGIGNSAGGSVTYSPAIPSTKRIIISRVLPYVQATALNNQDGFFPTVVEGALDYLTYLTQQLAAQYTNLSISSGNVPAPTAPQIGYVLTATSIGGFAWAVSGAPDLSIYMQKANNLSDLTNVVTARTNLGLGTAAQLNVGAGGSQVVQLDASAKLPAVDGSQLTNLPALSTTGVLVGVQTFTASGTYTPSTGVTRAKFTVVAPGGTGGGRSSAGTSGGGGAGEVRWGVFSVTPASPISITIGTAPAGAAANGGAASSTVVTGIITCNPGGPGLLASSGADGSGGSGGATGAPGPLPGFLMGIKGGEGRSGPFGFGGGFPLGSTISSATGGTGYGAGGGGGITTGSNVNGGKGSDGVVWIEEYK